MKTDLVVGHRRIQKNDFTPPLDCPTGKYSAISLEKGRAKMKNIFSLLLTLFVMLGATAVFAQETSTTGSISGSVIDSNGSVVPGAAVKVTGPLGERSGATNDQGYFEVQGLVPGNYTVRVEKSGFKTGEVTNVTVLVGK